MTKQTWIIASILSLAVVLGFFGLAARQQYRALQEARAELDTLRTQADNTQGEVHSLQEQLKAHEATIAQLEEEKTALQQEKEQVTKAHRSLEQEMRDAIESKEITISELQGKLTVNILDRILFDSGEATLKPEGQQVLKEIAGILANYPNRQIHVIGHTDNVPIRASARTRYVDNWELSTARALAAVRFLSEEAGVDPRRLGAVGYGEFHPLADNATAEGRAKNRRIALVVLSEELVGSDAVPSVTPIKLPVPVPPPGSTNVTETNTVSSTTIDSPVEQPNE